MIKFLFKGLIRDRSRSFFPVLIVVAGVLLTVVLYSWVKGIENNIIRTSANLGTGHVKIMSCAYAQEADQFPNDLALLGIGDLLGKLKEDFLAIIWTPRIRFAGLLDIPDEEGETKAQGPMVGLAVDLLSPSSPELEILNLKDSIVRGQMPKKKGEILVSDEFATKLHIQPGDIATLISSTMYGSMATANFTLAGTVRFGTTAMDRGAMIADIFDIQNVLDMEDAAGEILGFFTDNFYDNEKASEVASKFNANYEKKNDEFSPLMDTLRNQSGLAEMLDYIGSMITVIVGIFIFAMSIVLWNAGLMGSIRRYGEIGIRLAIGEDRGHVYRSMLAESMMIGLIGTFIGTAIGLAIAYYFQMKGINFSFLFKNASILMSNVARARVTPASYFVGFVPGLLASFLGTCISGLGIYKRQTSRLIKELER
jgi:putative ABC transport system permease protein